MKKRIPAFRQTSAEGREWLKAQRAKEKAITAAQAAVTQAERAVLEEAKVWASARHWEGDLVDAIKALEAAEKERDALNASTVPVGDGA